MGSLVTYEIEARLSVVRPLFVIIDPDAWHDSEGTGMKQHKLRGPHAGRRGVMAAFLAVQHLPWANSSHSSTKDRP